MRESWATILLPLETRKVARGNTKIVLLEDKGAGFHSGFECRWRETKISHQGKQMLVSVKPITSKLTFWK